MAFVFASNICAPYSAPEPKRRFVPSKHEHEKIMKFVRAIRAGRMTVGPKKREEEKTYNIWGTEAEESTSILARRANHIAAPKVATISMIYIYIYIYIIFNLTKLVHKDSNF